MKLPVAVLAFAILAAIPTVRADDTPLGSQMESLNDAYKALRKETDSAKGAAFAREAQQAVLKGLAENPEMLSKMADGPEKTKAAAVYRRMMGQLYVLLCDVETAFLEGKTDEVAKLVESIKELKKAGHDKFIEE
jgi:soluble cytochrome b562